MPRPTLILPRFVVPVRPRGQALEDCGVLVDQGRVMAVLPGDEARKSRAPGPVIELPDHVLMPGLINMHTHSPMSLLRGYADDLDLQRWLIDHIWPAEGRHADAQFVADGTRLAIAEMVRAGTTCFNDNYFFPDEMARVARDAGMRAVIGLPLLDQPSRWAGEFTEYMAKGLAVVEEFEGETLIDFALAPHAPYSITDSGLGRIAEVSTSQGLRVHMHCLETRFDTEHSMRTHGIGPLERLDRHALLNERLIAVHMTQLDERDIDRLAQRGTHVVHCPQSNLKLASGICPVPALLKAGVNVSLGTDGAASNNNLDLLEEARFAALLAKGASRDATALDALQAIDMMTINGAIALGMEDDLGTIEAGKLADLCALNLATVQTQPIHNVFSQIVYAASSAQFTDVWIGGERIMMEGELKTLDESALLANADEWRARLCEPGRSRKAAP